MAKDPIVDAVRRVPTRICHAESMFDLDAIYRDLADSSAMNSSSRLYTGNRGARAPQPCSNRTTGGVPLRADNYRRTDGPAWLGGKIAALEINFNLDAIYQDLKKREHEGEFTVVYRRPRRPRSGIRARIVNGKRSASS